MTVMQFLNGTTGLIAAIGVLLGGLAALLNALRELTKNRKSREPHMKPALTRRSRMALFIPSALLFLLSAGMFTARAVSGDQQPLNVQLTVAAWDAFNKGDFERAITNAERCIDEFRGTANREQAELEAAKVPAPGKGKVSDAEKKTILGRGILNDVATCYFIKGRAGENLGRRDVARQAYQTAVKLTYARCWDPMGWFWSPAEAAGDRLSGLK